MNISSEPQHAQATSNPPSDPKQPFAFSGKGSELWVLQMKNWLLSLVTLGMYRFKAKVNVRKYLWSHLTWQGQSFGFMGAAMDQVRGLGWLIAASVALIGGGALLGYAIHLQALAIPFIYLGFALLVIRMKFGGFRYRVRNTTYRGIRGNIAPHTFDDYLKQSIKGAFFTLITLGIYRSFNQVHLMKIKWNNTSWGRQPFSFHGDGKELFWLSFKGTLLCLVTLGIYTPWYLTKRLKYSVENIHFKDAPFKLELTGGEVFFFFIKALAVAGFTLGIGTPWMMVEGIKMFANAISYTGNVDFAQIESDLRAQQKTGADMAGDALDVDSDFDFAI